VRELENMKKQLRAADVQLWLEVVSTDAGKCSVIIEDGSVKAPAEAVVATD
jgi:hypothetical protein